MMKKEPLGPHLVEFRAVEDAIRERTRQVGAPVEELRLRALEILKHLKANSKLSWIRAKMDLYERQPFRPSLVQKHMRGAGGPIKTVKAKKRKKYSMPKLPDKPFRGGSMFVSGGLPSLGKRK